MAMTGHFDAADTDRLWKESGMTTHPANGEGVVAWDDEGDAADNAFFNTGSPPIYVVPAMNGLGSLDFSDTPMNAYNDAFVTQRAASTFLSVSAFTVIVAFQMEADATNDATIYSNTGLLADNAAFWGVHIKTVAGVHTAYIYNWDGAAKSVGQAFLRDVPNIFMGRFDGTTLYVSINGAAESTVGSGNNSDLTAQLFLGIGGGVRFYGKVGEFKFWNTGNADGNLATEIAAFIAKWIGAAGAGVRSSAFVGAFAGGFGSRGFVG